MSSQFWGCTGLDGFYTLAPSIEAGIPDHPLFLLETAVLALFKTPFVWGSQSHRAADMLANLE